MEFAFSCSNPLVHVLRVCKACGAQAFTHSVSQTVYSECNEFDRKWVSRSYVNATNNMYSVIVEIERLLTHPCR